MRETVLVSMRRTFGYQGQYYGPGSAVRVPVGLQVACNLPVVAETPAEDPKPEPKGKGK